jgi:hypothetical protein
MSVVSGPSVSSGAALLTWTDDSGNDVPITWDDANGNPQNLEWDV